jgi:hypothetical protein
LFGMPGTRARSMACPGILRLLCISAEASAPPLAAREAPGCEHLSSRLLQPKLPAPPSPDPCRVASVIHTLPGSPPRHSHRACLAAPATRPQHPASPCPTRAAHAATPSASLPSHFVPPFTTLQHLCPHPAPPKQPFAWHARAPPAAALPRSTTSPPPPPPPAPRVSAKPNCPVRAGAWCNRPSHRPTEEHARARMCA